MQSEQTEAPDNGVKISRLLGSLRNELSSWFKSAVQLHEMVANTTSVRKLGGRRRAI